MGKYNSVKFCIGSSISCYYLVTATFANRNPTPTLNDSVLMDYIWDQFQPSTSDYLYIGPLKAEMKQHFKAGRMAFWNDFIPSLRLTSPADGSDDDDDGSGGDVPPPNNGDGDDDDYDYEEYMWVFIGVSIGLLLLVFVLAGCLSQARRRGSS